MGLFDFLKDSKAEEQVKELVSKLTEEVTFRVTTKLQDEFVALAEVESATAKVIDLTKQIAVLSAEKSNIQEGFARKEREVEHKVGLLRQEIEAEKKQSKVSFDLEVKAAQLFAREVGLTEREKSFTEKMTFIEKRFTEEVGYLKTLVEDMAKRLPDASIIATKAL